MLEFDASLCSLQHFYSMRHTVNLTADFMLWRGMDQPVSLLRCTYTHTHTYSQFIYVYKHVYTYIYIYIYVYIFIYIYIYIWTHTHTVFTLTHTYSISTHNTTEITRSLYDTWYTSDNRLSVVLPGICCFIMKQTSYAPHAHGTHKFCTCNLIILRHTFDFGSNGVNTTTTTTVLSVHIPGPASSLWHQL